MQLIRFSGIDNTKMVDTRELHRLEMFYLESQTDCGKQNHLFWWNDPSYIIGGVTARERQVCVLIANKGNRFPITTSYLFLKR